MVAIKNFLESATAPSCEESPLESVHHAEGPPSLCMLNEVISSSAWVLSFVLATAT